MTVTFKDDYNPAAVETEAQKYWDTNDSFRVEIDHSREKFCKYFQFISKHG